MFPEPRDVSEMLTILALTAQTISVSEGRSETTRKLSTRWVAMMGVCCDETRIVRWCVEGGGSQTAQNPTVSCSRCRWVGGFRHTFPVISYQFLCSTAVHAHHHMKRLRVGKVRNKEGRARSGRLWFAVIVTFCAHGESEQRPSRRTDHRHVCCWCVSLAPHTTSRHPNRIPGTSARCMFRCTLAPIPPSQYLPATAHFARLPSIALATSVRGSFSL